MAASWRWCIGLALVLAAAHCAAQTTTFAYTASCAATKRFNAASLVCTACGTNQVPDASGLACTCAPGYVKVPSLTDPSGYSFTCSASCLNAGLAVSSDQSTCMGCGSNTTGLSATLKDCACPANWALVEADALGNLLANKTCTACPSGSGIDATASRYVCKYCPYPLTQQFMAGGTCGCKAGFTQTANWGYPTAAGTMCFAPSTDVATFNANPALQSTVVYRDVKTSDADAASQQATVIGSYVFSQLYLAAAVLCNVGADPAACQALGNLCVLQKYDATSSACAAFATIGASRSTVVNGFTSWKENMPLLTYPDAAILSSQALTMNVGFKAGTGGSVFDTLDFVLVKHALNGTYLGTEPLKLQLQLCQGQPSVQMRYLKFGSSYRLSCSLNLNALLAAHPPTATIFYDLYIQDAGGNLFPVPVKMLNYRVGGTQVNNANGVENMLPGTIKLVQRFFLVDGVSSQTSLGGATKYLVYANTISLRVVMQADSTTQIYPPYLVIGYAERAQDFLASASTVQFYSSHTKDLSSFWLGVNVSFGAFVILFGVVWIARFYASFRRFQLERFDFIALMRGIVLAFSLSADFFFVYLVGVSFYCFLFFKLQSTVFFLLPAPDSTDFAMFQSLLVYTFFAKAIDVLSILVRQAACDVFLIDWESPHTGDVEASGRKATVSVWRKLMVTNEWNDMQKEQSTSVELTLFLILFFLRGLSLEYLATQQPDATNLDATAAPINIVLRFAVSTFFWLAISYGQLVLQRVVYARFVHDRAASFVDLVSAANLSVLVMDEPYHGYYIHGRTVHEHADTSMEEMREQLLKEQLGLVKPRGLSGDKDTFEVFFSRDFRTRYDETFTLRLANDLQQRSERAREAAGSARAASSTEMGALSGGGGGRGSVASASGSAARGSTSAVGSTVGAGLKLPDPKTIAASNRLNAFLIEFIEKRGKLVWSEALRNYCEKFLDLPPQISDNGASLFYSDDEHDFRRVLMTGCERDWFIMSALFYAVLDIAFSNTFVSILVVFAANRLVAMIRSYFAGINISTKTLVDEKFLL